MRAGVCLAVFLVQGIAVDRMCAEVIYVANGHAYDFVSVPGGITWLDAKAGAELLTTPIGFQAGHLLTVSNAAENQFVVDNFASLVPFANSPDGVWAGFTDQLVEGEWRWVDDTPGIWQDPDEFAMPVQTAYSNWDGSTKPEPNNGDGGFPENFLSFRTTGLWNDLSVGPTPPTGYLVEWDPLLVPEPNSIILAGMGFLAILILQLVRISRS